MKPADALNMQNIPAKEAVGNRYRNCFVAEPGWTYVDSDYASQELVVIAYISNDPVWMRALQKGEDLHSVCAELVFGKKWKAAAEPGCAFYENKHKCKCKGHKRMRDQVKVVNFGLAYGMSKFKLSATLRIDLVEAEMLIDAYFKAFPGIGKALRFLGLFGVRNGYIQTLAPFFRKRWFPYWRYARHAIDAHIHEVDYNPTLGSIERASKNMPEMYGHVKSSELGETCKMAIPNQAILGLSSMEGVTTRSVSPNNNPVQERSTLGNKNYLAVYKEQI